MVDIPNSREECSSVLFSERGVVPQKKAEMSDMCVVRGWKAVPGTVPLISLGQCRSEAGLPKLIHLSDLKEEVWYDGA